MSSIEFWKEECIKAFNGESKANDFILFFEGCKKLSGDEYNWTTTEYKHEFQSLDCIQQENQWSLSLANYTTLTNLKSQIRSQWHIDRQKTLKEHLEKTLQQHNNTSPLDITVEQRLALIREFMLNHEKDLGSIPFIKGLSGLLKYQLDHKQFLVEWKMSEYVLTQNNEEAMEDYVRLLKGVFGLQLVYQDDEQQVVIDIDQQQQNEPVLTWRMNPDANNSFIQQALKCVTKQQSVGNSVIEYRVTDIPRNQAQENKTLFQWLFDLISQCLFFL